MLKNRTNRLFRKRSIDECMIEIDIQLEGNE